MRLISIIVTLVALFLQASYAQPNISPSRIPLLKAQLAKVNSDTSKVQLLCQLTQAYTAINLDSASAYARAGMALAEKIRDLNGQIDCAVVLGFVLIRTNESAEALKLLIRTLRLADKQQNFTQKSVILSQLANLYLLRNDLDKSRQYLQEAKALNDKYSIPELDSPLGLSFGQMYLATGQYDSSLYHFNKVYQLAKQANRDALLTSATYYLGDTYLRKKETKNAIPYFYNTVSYAHQFQNPYTLPRAYQGLAKAYLSLNRKDSAIYYARKAIEGELASAYQLTTTINMAAMLSEIYEAQNNTKESLKYLKIASAAKDTAFVREKAKEMERVVLEEQIRQQRIKQRLEDEQQAWRNKIEIYGLLAGTLVLSLISFILYNNNRKERKARQLLHRQKEEIDFQRNKAEHALEDLKATQAQLIQSEKLASLGELTAGIAHEIQNPLNFVNNFAELSVELIEEAPRPPKGASDNWLPTESPYGGWGTFFDDLKMNLEKINFHGKRAASIVTGMLHHSRASTGVKEPTDINALADEYLRLSYHGLRAKDKSFNAQYELIADPDLPKINVVPQDIGRVLLNLINNAFQSQAASPQTPEGGLNKTHKVTVKTFKIEASNEAPFGTVRRAGWGLSVSDNGAGIPDDVLPKIFQPFFTTKPTGQGTGLGLSLAYDIVTKGHGGTLEVESKVGEGTIFTIKLPL